MLLSSSSPPNRRNRKVLQRIDPNITRTGSSRSKRGSDPSASSVTSSYVEHLNLRANATPPPTNQNSDIPCDPASVQEFRTTFNEVLGHIEGHFSDCDAKIIEITELKAKLHARDAEIIELKVKLHARDAQNTEVQVKLDEQNAVNTELVEELRERKAEIMNLIEQLALSEQKTVAAKQDTLFAKKGTDVTKRQFKWLIAVPVLLALKVYTNAPCESLVPFITLSTNSSGQHPVLSVDASTNFSGQNIITRTVDPLPTADHLSSSSVNVSGFGSPVKDTFETAYVSHLSRGNRLKPASLMSIDNNSLWDLDLNPFPLVDRVLLSKHWCGVRRNDSLGFFYQRESATISAMEHGMVNSMQPLGNTCAPSEKNVDPMPSFCTKWEAPSQSAKVPSNDIHLNHLSESYTDAPSQNPPSGQSSPSCQRTDETTDQRPNQPFESTMSSSNSVYRTNQLVLSTKLTILFVIAVIAGVLALSGQRGAGQGAILTHTFYISGPRDEFLQHILAMRIDDHNDPTIENELIYQVRSL